MERERRAFLQRMAAGATLLSLSPALAGCATSPERAVAAPDNPFLDWFGVDDAVLAKTVSQLIARGTDIADVYLQHRRTNTLKLEQDQSVTSSIEVQAGAGLRTVYYGATRFGYTDDLTETGLLLAARTVETGNQAAFDSFPVPTIGDRYEIELPWSEVGLEQKSALIGNINEQVRAADPTITDVRIFWTDVDERVLIATESGAMFADVRPMTRLAVQVTANRAGATQSGFAHISGRQDFNWYDQRRIDELIATAVSRTDAMFEARLPLPGEMPVVLGAGTASVLLHEAVGHGFEADLVASGESPFAGLIGERVADAAVTLVDDATLPHERGAMNIDDEGTSGQRTVLVEDGVVRNFVHDRVSARRAGVVSTGSGRRESYRYAPQPRMSCTVMQSADSSIDEIIATADNGILAETITAGRVNIATGQFEFHVQNGWLIEAGSLTFPIKDVILTGSGSDLLRNIALVGNDAAMDKGGWTCGKNEQRVAVSHGMPTVLVSRLAVSHRDL